jgi:hypothetical protein
MSLPASWAVQLGLYAALEGAPGLEGVAVHDDVLESARHPFLTIGEARSEPLPGVEGARTHEVRIHAYSRWGGRAELKRLEEAVHGALHDRALPLEGHRLASCRFVFADVLRQADTDTYHAVMRYRLVTEPTVQGA